MASRDQPLALSMSAVVAVLSLFLATAWYCFGQRRGSYPPAPGPPADPLIGHARFMKPRHSWLWYTELKKQYGGLVGLSAFGIQIVVINSFKVASDLLGKRATIYSDRPRLPWATEMSVTFYRVESNTSSGGVADWSIIRRTA